MRVASRSNDAPAGAPSFNAFVFLALAVALVVFSLRLSHSMVAVPSVEWMRLHRASDFSDRASLVAFLRGLNVPIPPLLATAEILSQQWLGSTWPVTIALYRVALVGSYVAALWLCRRSLARLCLSAFSASICIWATCQIHPFNPQVYDVVLPFFVLLYIVALDTLATTSWSGRLAPALVAFLAGLSLSLAELTRPFVLLLLPVLLLPSWRPFRRSSTLALAFCLPLALLSGVWHLHLMTTHGQLLSSNYSGFNLHRAWPQVPLPPGAYDANQGRGHEDEHADLSAPEFGRASRAFSLAVARHVASHPVEASHHALDRLVLFVAPQTELYGRRPQAGAVLTLYIWTTRILLAYAVLNLLGLIGLVARGQRNVATLLTEPTHVLLLLIPCLVFILALGEAGEEARLMLSVLPLLAAFPTLRCRSSEAG